MKKFVIKFQRDFEVEFEAADLKTAGEYAKRIVDNFPQGTCKILSVRAEDCVGTTSVEPAYTAAESEVALRNADFAQRIKSLTPDEPSVA